jgi:hypothetical protein
MKQKKSRKSGEEKNIAIQRLPSSGASKTPKLAADANKGTSKELPPTLSHLTPSSFPSLKNFKVLFWILQNLNVLIKRLADTQSGRDIRACAEQHPCGE